MGTKASNAKILSPTATTTNPLPRNALPRNALPRTTPNALPRTTPNALPRTTPNALPPTPNALPPTPTPTTTPNALPPTPTPNALPPTPTPTTTLNEQRGGFLPFLPVLPFAIMAYLTVGAVNVACHAIDIETTSLCEGFSAGQTLMETAVKGSLFCLGGAVSVFLGGGRKKSRRRQTNSKRRRQPNSKRRRQNKSKRRRQQ
jgi:hypothetical protein